MKSSLYKSLVRPILEYACTIWAPHCQRDIQHIEAIQRRAARFTMNRYGRYENVTNMLHQLDWPTLYVRRNHMQHSLPLTYSNLHSTLRGHSYKLSQPVTRIDSYNSHFFPSTITMWNSLPSLVVKAESFNQFKNNIVNLYI